MNTTRKHNMKGQALTEFAIVAPIFILLLFGILEFGRAFYIWSIMSEATREGVRSGVVEIVDSNAMTVATNVTNDVLNQANMTNVTVSAVIQQISGVDVLNVQANYAFQPLSLIGIIPPLNLQAKSVMRQEGQ